jgi:hypothetical protein
MRLWTIQTEDAWTRAKRQGVLVGDGRGASPAWRPAYRWMAGARRRRLPTARRSAVAPVWVWLKWSGNSTRPDLRTPGHLPSGTRAVRLDWEDTEMCDISAGFSELSLGSGTSDRQDRTESPECRSVVSGSGEAWYRARFGTERSRVRIPPSRPLARRIQPHPEGDIRLNQSRPEERSVQQVRGCARGGRVSHVTNVERIIDRSRAGDPHGVLSVLDPNSLIPLDGLEKRGVMWAPLA